MPTWTLMAFAALLSLAGCKRADPHRPEDVYRAAKHAFATNDYQRFATFFTHEGQVLIGTRLAFQASIMGAVLGELDESNPYEGVFKKHRALLAEPPVARTIESKMPSGHSLEDQATRAITGLAVIGDALEERLRQHPDPSRFVGDLLAAMNDVGAQPKFAELFRVEAELAPATINENEACASLKFVGTAASSVRFARVSGGWLIAELTP